MIEVMKRKLIIKYLSLVFRIEVIQDRWSMRREQARFLRKIKRQARRLRRVCGWAGIHSDEDIIKLMLALRRRGVRIEGVE